MPEKSRSRWKPFSTPCLVTSLRYEMLATPVHTQLGLDPMMFWRWIAKVWPQDSGILYDFCDWKVLHSFSNFDVGGLCLVSSKVSRVVSFELMKTWWLWHQKSMTGLRLGVLAITGAFWAFSQKIVRFHNHGPISGTVHNGLLMRSDCGMSIQHFGAHFIIYQPKKNKMGKRQYLRTANNFLIIFANSDTFSYYNLNIIHDNVINRQ